MSHNAALLQQVGYTQLQSGNQLIASLAQEMVDAASMCGFTPLCIDLLQGRTSCNGCLFSAAHAGSSSKTRLIERRLIAADSALQK